MLSLREKMNKRRPKFIRAEWHRLKRLRTSWRRPKGIDSKMREKRKGKRKSPSSGYRGPKLVRGLHPSGKEVVRVFNTKDLEEVDPDNQIAQIGSKVGSRKRTELIHLAEDLDIHIINPQIRRLEFDEEGEEEFTEDDFEEIEEEDLSLEDDFELVDEEEEVE